MEQDEGLSAAESAGPEYEVLTDRLPTGNWRVDPDSSQLNFRARTLFVLPVNGFFENFSGVLHIDQEGNASGALVIDTASIQTGLRGRDQHLRGADYFLAEQHPEMTFTVKSLTTGRDGLKLAGSLRIRDRSLPLSFPVTAIAHGDHLHIEGRAQVDLATGGLGWAKPGTVGPSARADVALTLQPDRPDV
jgi:polyisoprenoid-binding protein YceI